MRSSRSRRWYIAICREALTSELRRLSQKASRLEPLRQIPRSSILIVAKSALVAGLLMLPLAGCRPHDFPQYPANYREYAYVTNGGSGTVSIYDVVNVRLDRELRVGQNPVAVTASPTRNEVYVVNSGAPGAQGSVTVLNAENNSVA